MTDSKQIAILTLENDIHALAIRKAFESYNDVVCHIIETNRISNKSKLCWSSLSDSDIGSGIATMDGEYLDIGKIDLIWWRRVNYAQKISSEITDPRYIDLINNDCREALFGLFVNEFSGQWINDPTATRLAENKLIQLKVARDAGFRIPRTIVSQDPSKIKKFCMMLKNNVVVKPVKGTHKHLLLSAMLKEEDLAYTDSMSLAPAIYQEYIPGEKHIRVQCFGDAIFAATIESKELDWRQNIDIPFKVTDLSKNTKMRIRNVLKALGLKMGIFDLKIDEESIPIWLEINPQGQFLFVEGMTGLDLTSHFANFLYEEAKEAKEAKESG